MGPCVTPKQIKRCWFLGSLLTAGAGVVIIVLTSLNDHLLFFATPSDVFADASGGRFLGKSIRLGGIVQKGSVSRSADGLSITFVLTDHHHAVSVQFKGIVPDLFREGQTIIAQGLLKQGALKRTETSGYYLTATRLLAKHDENYTPRELIKTLPSHCQNKL